MTKDNSYKTIFIYFLIIVSSFYLAHYLVKSWVPTNIFDFYTGATFFTVPMYMLAFLSLNEKNPLSIIFFIKFILAILSASVFSSALSYYLIDWRFEPNVLILSTGFIFLFTYLYKVILYFFSSKHIENIAIIGTGKSAILLKKELEKHNKLYKFKSYIDYERSNYDDSISPKDVYKNLYNLKKFLKENKINTVVLAKNLDPDDELLTNIVDMKLLGYNVLYMANFYEELTGKVPIKYINNNWFISSKFHAIFNRFYLNFKRLSDIGVSLLGLLLSSPVLLISAILIKLQDMGPIFFIQDRIGKGGKTFKIIKFRTMSLGSEKGNKYTQENDSRITKIGKFLRKTRIDEIPQFINVIKGDMSIIGPRAEWDDLVKTYEKKIPYYSIRHMIKPGITGWAQVEFKYGSSIDDAYEKLQYDLYYIKHQSFILDMTIAVKTVKVVLSFGGK